MENNTNYCNQCKKKLNNDFFDIKKNGDHYTRCKKCRAVHNKQSKEKYKKKKCSRRTLCNDKDCKVCLERSLEFYKGKTPNAKKYYLW